MEAPDGNPFPEIEAVSIPERLRRVGRFLNRFVLGPHLNWPEHPFDNELYDQLNETSDGTEAW